MSNQQDGGAPETRRGRQEPQAERFWILNHAGGGRCTGCRGGKGISCIPSAAILGSWDRTHLALRWRPGWEVMCIQMGKHLNSACGEMFTLCTAVHGRQTLTRQHRAVAHSGHGVQSRSGGGRAEAKLYRACTSSSLISISPPPSCLGWLSGHGCWPELCL